MLYFNYIHKLCNRLLLLRLLIFQPKKKKKVNRLPFLSFLFPYNHNRTYKHGRSFSKYQKGGRPAMTEKRKIRSGDGQLNYVLDIATIYTNDLTIHPFSGITSQEPH